MLSRLIMLGTSPLTRGGIASVINTYCALGWFERWQAEYVATHCDGTTQRKLIAALRALGRFIWLLVRDGRAVLHVHSASRASFWRKCVFMSIGLAAGCPILLHLHGGAFRRFYEDECGPVRRYIVRFFLERAACVIVLSEATRSWLAGVTRNRRVECVPNPVSLRASERADRIRDLVLFVGRIERDKGAFDLLEAFCAIRAQVPEMALVYAGEGERDELARRAVELGMRHALPITGWIDRSAVHDLLERAAVFVLPSYAEGQPMSLLEAMAAGTPVITTAVGAVPEMVKHGVTGFLVPPGDQAALQQCLRQVLAARATRDRVASAARAWVLERHAPERVLERLAAVYRERGLAPRACSGARLPRRNVREAA